MRDSGTWQSHSLWSRSRRCELRHGVRSHDVYSMVDRLDENGEGSKVAGPGKDLRHTVIASPTPKSGDRRGNPLLSSATTKPFHRRWKSSWKLKYSTLRCLRQAM